MEKNNSISLGQKLILLGLTVIAVLQLSYINSETYDAEFLRKKHEKQVAQDAVRDLGTQDCNVVVKGRLITGKKFPISNQEIECFISDIDTKVQKTDNDGGYQFCLNIDDHHVVNEQISITVRVSIAGDLEKNLTYSLGKSIIGIRQLMIDVGETNLDQNSFQNINLLGAVVSGSTPIQNAQINIQFTEGSIVLSEINSLSDAKGVFNIQAKVVDLQVLIIKLLVKKEGYYDYDSRKDSQYDHGGYEFMAENKHDFSKINLKQRFIKLSFIGTVMTYYRVPLAGAKINFEFTSLDSAVTYRNSLTSEANGVAILSSVNVTHRSDFILSVEVQYKDLSTLGFIKSFTNIGDSLDIKQELIVTPEQYQGRVKGKVASTKGKPVTTGRATYIATVLPDNVKIQHWVDLNQLGEFLITFDTFSGQTYKSQIQVDAPGYAQFISPTFNVTQYPSSFSVEDLTYTLTSESC